MGYDPRQPRDPFGTPTGGQWSKFVSAVQVGAGLPSELERDYSILHDVLGKNLIVENLSSSVVKRHLEDLGRVPVSALAELKRYGVKIYVANVSVSGFPGMEGTTTIRPPGWGKGSTFKDMAGLYSSGKVYLGKGNWDIPSLAIHEVAHAVDDMKGISEKPEMQAYYEEYQSVKGAYHTDPTDVRHIEEFFAGSVTEIFMRQEQVYKKDYVDFVYKMFGGKSD